MHKLAIAYCIRVKLTFLNPYSPFSRGWAKKPEINTFQTLTPKNTRKKEIQDKGQEGKRTKGYE
ncbi:MAG: hypothetical protein WBM86_09935, partial [Waterburya sp.]